MGGLETDLSLQIHIHSRPVKLFSAEKNIAERKVEENIYAEAMPSKVPSSVMVF